MTVIFNSTAGSYLANSYLSVEDADDWMTKRLYADDWTSAPTASKQSSLMWATRLLERYSWKGEPSDAGTSPPQALRWPMKYVLDLDGNELDSTTIPAFLQEATAELALFLIKGDRTDDPDGAGFKRLQVGSIEIEPDIYKSPGILPKSIMDLIDPYLLRPLNSTARKLDRS